MKTRQIMVGVACVSLACTAPARAEPGSTHLDRVRALMATLRAESVAHAESIADAYDDAPELAFADRDALREALAQETLMPVPAGAEAMNLALRISGAHQIGALDPAHQALYRAARPEVVGMLLDIASRVRSGPLDVTSLVRHRAYQWRLSRTNPNARTGVPTHVLGLAADISVLHRPLAHARELRDVLRQMAEAGQIHVVAEQRHVVFHVVPAADRREYFAEFARALAAAPALGGVYTWRRELEALPPLTRGGPPRSASDLTAVAWEDVPAAVRVVMAPWTMPTARPAALGSLGLLGLGSLAVVRRARRPRPAGPAARRPRRGRRACVRHCGSVVVLVLATGSLRGRPAAEPLHLPLVPQIDPFESFSDDTPLTVTVTAGTERLPTRVTADDLRGNAALWRRMHLADWNVVPPPLRRAGLDAMVSHYSALFANPAVWASMGPTDWDHVPQPIRTAAYRQMVRYWTAHYEVGAAWGHDADVIADTVAAVVMSESWFDHRGQLVNTDGSLDLGLAGASEFARRRLRELQAEGRVDVAFADGAYLNPWNATRFAAIWFGLLLGEAQGDRELAVRAYNRGIARARDARGTTYLAAVRRRLERFVQNGNAPPAWAHLWSRARELEQQHWRIGPLGQHPDDEAWQWHAETTPVRATDRIRPSSPGEQG